MALIKNLDQFQTQISTKEEKDQKDKREHQFREQYRQKTYDTLEEDIKKHEFRPQYDDTALSEQIALFKELIARIERLVPRPQGQPPVRGDGVTPSNQSVAPVDATSTGEAGEAATEEDDTTEDALQRVRCQQRMKEVMRQKMSQQEDEAAKQKEKEKAAYSFSRFDIQSEAWKVQGQGAYIEASPLDI